MNQPSPNQTAAIERAFQHGFQSLSEIVERALAKYPLRKPVRSKKREQKTA